MQANYDSDSSIDFIKKLTKESVSGDEKVAKKKVAKKEKVVKKEAVPGDEKVAKKEAVSGDEKVAKKEKVKRTINKIAKPVLAPGTDHQTKLYRFIQQIPICMNHMIQEFGPPTIIGDRDTESNIEWVVSYNEHQFVICDMHTMTLKPERTIKTDRNLYVFAMPYNNIHKDISCIVKEVRAATKSARCKNCKTYYIEYNPDSDNDDSNSESESESDSESESESDSDGIKTETESDRED